MKVKRTSAFKRVLACAAAVVICATVMAGAGHDAVRTAPASAESAEMKENKKDISETEVKLDELAKKQKELDEKISSTKDDISSEEENQAAIEEQIATVQETIQVLDESIVEKGRQINELERDIAEKENQIAAKKAEIENGVSDFKSRVRAMYVSGTSSYSDIIIGANDFYDMLMKIELVKRVAEHDDGMIDSLVALKKQYEADEAELADQKAHLEKEQADLKAQQEAHEKQRVKLEELYTQSKAYLAKLAEEQAYFEANKDLIAQEEAEFEDQLQKLYKEQTEIKKRDEANAATRKAAEEYLAKVKNSVSGFNSAYVDSTKKSAVDSKIKALEKALDGEDYDDIKVKQAELGNAFDTLSSDVAKKQAEEAERIRQQELARQQAAQNSNNTSTSGSSGSTTTTTTPSNSSTYASDYGGNQTSLSNSDYNYTNSKSQFTWPVPGYYHISYGVGWRWGAYHKGIDIWSSGIRGAKICAAASGTVILVSNTCTHDYGKNYSCGCGGGYGNYCIIDHGNGYWTLYGHSQGITVKQGQYVEQGDVLGVVGSTGHSTGDHLHFEVRLNGVAQDPQNYV